MQLLVVATGRVPVVLINDARTLLLPASDVQISQALEPLKCFRLMQGLRAKAAVDVEPVVDTIRGLIDFAAKHRASLLQNGCLSIDDIAAALHCRRRHDPGNAGLTMLAIVVEELSDLGQGRHRFRHALGMIRYRTKSKRNLPGLLPLPCALVPAY